MKLFRYYTILLKANFGIKEYRTRKNIYYDLSIILLNLFY